MMNWFPAFKIMAVIALVIIFYAWISEQVADRVWNAVERQNNEVAHDADTARLGFDACLDAGGLWDSAARECRRSP